MEHLYVCVSSRLPAVADRFEHISLWLLLCFKVKLSSNTVKKNVFIRWLLTLFKVQRKAEILRMLYALGLHKPIDGWILSLLLLLTLGVTMYNTHIHDTTCCIDGLVDEFYR